MHLRLIASLVIVCIALGAGGCSSTKTNRKSKDRKYKEVLMPLQTGSHLRRRILVPVEERDKKPTKKKESKAPKPDTEPSATPAPEEESTPPPDRFR